MNAMLSDLQRRILARAAKFQYAYYPDLLATIFGWEFVRPIERYPETEEEGWAGQLIDPRPPFFDPQQIGPDYNRKMASLSRACKRLKARGLITRHYARCGLGRWGAVRLTEAGAEVVEKLKLSDGCQAS